MRCSIAILFLLLTACGDSSGPGSTPPVEYHDPEILFTMNAAYPDTAIMRWYRETGVKDSLLAQVEITAGNSVCAFFLVTSGTPMYFDIGWKRHGVTTIYSTVGPFNPTNPDDYDPYWHVSVSEDTLTSSVGTEMQSSRTRSFCPQGVPRDSITARPLP